MESSHRKTEQRLRNPRKHATESGSSSHIQARSRNNIAPFHSRTPVRSLSAQNGLSHRASMNQGLYRKLSASAGQRQRSSLDCCSENRDEIEDEVTRGLKRRRHAKTLEPVKNRYSPGPDSAQSSGFKNTASSDEVDGQSPSLRTSGHEVNTQVNTSEEASQNSGTQKAGELNIAQYQFKQHDSGGSRIVMLREPITFQITPEQLIKEIKAIYAALVIAETRCIDADKLQAAKIKANEKGEVEEFKDNWPELIGLHKTLLNEHHDFLLASQHVAATPALKELAAKYQMAPRLWKHSIHSMLEILRYRLPSSKEYMLSFVYHTYQMMCLLYETVPSFHCIWSECAGDLARYRMAIEDEDLETRAIWTEMARWWYIKTSDASPGVGRLFHHMGILAKTSPFQQLYLYNRALISETPFRAALESMICGMEHHKTKAQTSAHSGTPLEIAFIDVLDITLKDKDSMRFNVALMHLISVLNVSISQGGVNFRRDGAYMAIACIGGALGHGDPQSTLRRVLDDHYAPRSDSAEADGSSESEHDVQARNLREADIGKDPTQTYAIDLLIGVFKVAIGSYLDDSCKRCNPEVLAFIHIVLVFMWSLVPVHQHAQQNCHLLRYLFEEFPWTGLCTFITALQVDARPDKRMMRRQVLFSIDEKPKLVREDQLMYKTAISKNYLPDALFEGVESPGEEIVDDSPETDGHRVLRLFWLMHKISVCDEWVFYDKHSSVWVTKYQGLNYEQSSIDSGSELANSSDFDTVSTVTSGSENEASLETSKGNPANALKLSTTISKVTKPEVVLEWLKQRDVSVDLVKNPKEVDKWLNNVMATGQQDLAVAPQEGGPIFKRMICDKNAILYGEDLFEKFASDTLIVIPRKVIVKLRRQRRQNTSKSAKDLAHQALLRITLAVKAQKKIQIWTADGSDVTEEALSAELSYEFEKDSLDTDESSELLGIIKKVKELDVNAIATTEPPKPMSWGTLLCISKFRSAFKSRRQAPKQGISRTSTTRSQVSLQSSTDSLMSNASTSTSIFEADAVLVSNTGIDGVSSSRDEDCIMDDVNLARPFALFPTSRMASESLPQVTFKPASERTQRSHTSSTVQRLQ